MKKLATTDEGFIADTPELKDYVNNLFDQFYEDYLGGDESLRERFVEQVVDIATGTLKSEEDICNFVDGLLIGVNFLK